MKFTHRELMDCIEREIRWRKRVYPNRVLTGRMKKDEADRQINMMQCILDVLHHYAKSEMLL